MQEYLINYIKALFKKDFQSANKISKELYKLGMDKITLSILIQDKELINKAKNELKLERK